MGGGLLRGLPGREPTRSGRSGKRGVSRGTGWHLGLQSQGRAARPTASGSGRRPVYSDFALRCAASADASFNPPAHLPAAALSIQSEPCQAQINETTADLKGVTGDPDVQSGSIATNPKELAALRLKGERNYTDVKLGRTKQPQRFGVITLKLDSVNPKQGRYTVEIVADDKTIAKKDKHINEPVQFYTATGGHTPYELVIYQINKDGIVGYLSTPKARPPRHRPPTQHRGSASTPRSNLAGLHSRTALATSPCV